MRESKIRWRKNNPEKRSATTKRYRSRHSKSINEYLRNYQKLHKDETNEYRKKYYRTDRGFDIISKAQARRRNLGFNKLIENDWNEPIEWHHINDVDVVPIPKELHKMCLRGTTKEHREICNELINILYEGELRV